MLDDVEALPTAIASEARRLGGTLLFPIACGDVVFSCGRLCPVHREQQRIRFRVPKGLFELTGQAFEICTDQPVGGDGPCGAYGNNLNA